MAEPGPEALAKLQDVIRQLRGIPQVREKWPGTFHLLGQPFVAFHAVEGRLSAELRKASGSGVDRYPVETAPEQRKLIDDAKRRAARFVDE